MKVSVITVCRNAGATVGQTIESVLAQDYHDTEYIVVDGASTDNTPAILAEYADRISHFVSEPDNGIYDAMNKGVGLTAGTWVCFMNADDIFAGPDILRQAMHILANDPETMFAYGDCWIEDEGGQRRFRRHPPNMGRFQLYAAGFACQQVMFYHRQALTETVGLFDASYAIAADYDWAARALLRHRVPCRHLDLPVCVFRQFGLSATDIRTRHNENTRVRRTYFSPWERCLFRPAKAWLDLCAQLRSGSFKLPDALTARLRSSRS